MSAVDREVAESMKDRLSPIDLYRLQDVLVMTENEVGTSVDCCSANFGFVIGHDDWAEVHPPVR